jgi:hypothetical protein
MAKHKHCSEISSPMTEPIKTPLGAHDFFTLGSDKKQLLNFMKM